MILLQLHNLTIFMLKLVLVHSYQLNVNITVFLVPLKNCVFERESFI